MLNEPACFKRKCKWFVGMLPPTDDNVEDGPVVCKAFPNGIPDEIYEGLNLHNEPFPGDNGIQYTKATESEWQDVLTRLA